MSGDGSKTPLGTITTLLDLTNRDLQENDLFPLRTETTWFTRDPDRRLLPFTPLIQEIPFRGPAAFGQRFSFDVGSLLAGDLLFGTVLQIKLGHWLDAQTRNMLACGEVVYHDPATGWEYANSLGSSIIQEAELEIDGQTIETLDGDFINTFSLLYPDFNSQFGIAYDHLGRLSLPRLISRQSAQPNEFPTEQGILHCILPFFFMRTRYQDSLPLIGIKEGLVRIHITLRPFSECVRQMRGYRDSCTDTPIDKIITFDQVGTNDGFGNPIQVNVPTAPAPPSFESLQLITYGSILEGSLRKSMLHKPFEALHRELLTFYFQEPLNYSISKRSDTDTIRIALPLEANHPLEELIWFVRRKGVADNNAWTNYTAFLEQEWPQYTTNLPSKPLLQRAAIQVNGTTLIEAEEDVFRTRIATAHRGGIAPYKAFVYGYSFARYPGEHQPSGSLNASRVNSLRLILDVKPPGGVLDANWEVKVFCINMNWMRYENGLANSLFED